MASVVRAKSSYKGERKSGYDGGDKSSVENQDHETVDHVVRPVTNVSSQGETHEDEHAS